MNWLKKAVEELRTVNSIIGPWKGTRNERDNDLFGLLNTTGDRLLAALQEAHKRAGSPADLMVCHQKPLNAGDSYSVEILKLDHGLPKYVLLQIYVDIRAKEHKQMKLWSGCNEVCDYPSIRSILAGKRDDFEFSLEHGERWLKNHVLREVFPPVKKLQAR